MTNDAGLPKENRVEQVLRYFLPPFIAYCLYTTTIGINLDTASIVGMIFVYVYVSSKRRIVQEAQFKRQTEKAAQQHRAAAVTEPAALTSASPADAANEATGASKSSGSDGAASVADVASAAASGAARQGVSTRRTRVRRAD